MHNEVLALLYSDEVMNDDLMELIVVRHHHHAIISLCTKAGPKLTKVQRQTGGWDAVSETRF